MPPWVVEVARFLSAGSSSGWWGLVCPTHCNSPSSWLDFVLAACAPFALASGSSTGLGLGPSTRPPGLRVLHRPPPALRRTCVNEVAPASLTETLRSIARSLRVLADSLDSVASPPGASSALPGLTPEISSDTVDTVDWDLINHLDSLSGHLVSQGSALAPGPSSSVPAGYNGVARGLSPLPDHCLDLCRRLSGTPEEIKSRAKRAWEAGLWARATLEGRVNKPRPTPKLALQASVYVVLRGPGIERPTRVSTAAEYFKLLPTFENSISHSFPSQAEARVYCLAAGVVFPEPGDQ